MVSIPGGDEEPDEDLANFEGNVGNSTPVGIYPSGAAPSGHLDMAGNVWEWNQDSVGNGGGRVRRGGSWNVKARYCRSVFRINRKPDYRVDSLGFRLSRSLDPWRKVINH